MNFADPQERSVAAGEYVLGTLDDDDRRTVEQALVTDPALQADVYAWQDRLLDLAQRAGSVEPPAHLWQGIARRLARPTTLAPAETASPALVGQSANDSQWRRLRVWQGIGGLAVAASLVLTTLLVTRTPEATEPRYLAVLQAPDQSVGWVVEARAGGVVRLVPVGDATAVPPGKVLQFWTKAQTARGPTSLGLVAPGRVTELPVARLPTLEVQQLFELTLEPEGGSPLDRPTGPVLFLGRTVQL